MYNPPGARSLRFRCTTQNRDSNVCALDDLRMNVAAPAPPPILARITAPARVVLAQLRLADLRAQRIETSSSRYGPKYRRTLFSIPMSFDLESNVKWRRYDGRSVSATKAAGSVGIADAYFIGFMHDEFEIPAMIQILESTQRSQRC